VRELLEELQGELVVALRRRRLGVEASTTAAPM